MTAPGRSFIAMGELARKTRWLALTAAVLFLGAAIGLAFFLQSRNEKRERQPVQGAVYIGSELRIEMSAFRLRLIQALLTGDAGDRQLAAEAYEVLLSRLAMLDSNVKLRLPSDDLKLTARYRELSAEIKSWEPRLMAIAAGDASRGAILMERINENAVELAYLTTLVNEYTYAWLVRNAESLDDHFILLAIFAMAMAVLLAALTRSLFLAAGRAEAVYQDLRTAHRDAAEARKAVDRHDLVRSRFLANVSHELRTPLNAIVGFSEVLLDKSGGARTEARREEYLGYVLKSGRHLLSLINDLLDFSRIQQGHWEPRYAPVDLRAELTEALRLTAEVAAGRRIRLMERFPVESPVIETDARAFRQILLNVLSNAVRFSPPDGRIEVEMRRTARGVAIEVDDDGPPVEDDFVRQRGAPFSLGRSAAYVGDAGTGLGLDIAKELMQRIGEGGALAIANRPEGGLRVTLTFPARPPSTA